MVDTNRTRRERGRIRAEARDGRRRRALPRHRLRGTASGGPPLAISPRPIPRTFRPRSRRRPPCRSPPRGEPVETWSVSVEGVPIRELLFALARDAGADVDIDPGIEERVTMNAVDEPFSRLVDRISRNADLSVEIEDGVLVVRRDEPVLRTYPIDYVSLTRETETVNEVGTGVGGGIEASAGEENGSAANVKARAEHRFWDTLVESVRGVLGEAPDEAASVFAHRETSLIAVRANAAGHREVALLLDRILASARRQVLIEATIVEVELDDRFRGGVDLSRVFGDVAIESSLLAGNLGAPPFAGLSIPDLSLTVRLLGEFGDVRVLSTPLVMALNNQTAIVKIAENRVFFTSEVRTETNETSVERNVQTKLHTVPVGLILLVTPSVAADDEIILKVRPTVTRESGFAVDPNPELAAAGGGEPDSGDRGPRDRVRAAPSKRRGGGARGTHAGGGARGHDRGPAPIPASGNRGRVPVPGPGPGQDRAHRVPAPDGDPGAGPRRGPRQVPPVVAGHGRAGRAGAGRARARPNAVRRGRRGSAPHRAGASREPCRRTALAGLDRAPARRPPYRADHLPRGGWTLARRRPWPALPPPPSARDGSGRPGRGTSASPPAIRSRRPGARCPSSSTPAGIRRCANASSRGGSRGHRRRRGSRWRSGNALAEQGRWEAAAGAYRDAHRAAPSNPDPAYNLAVSAERRGRPRRALSHYRDALDLAALAPPAFDVRAARDRIAALEGRAGIDP